MENKNKILTGLAAGGALLAAHPALAQYSPTPEFTGKIGKTVAETRTAYPRRNPVARPGSPNVVWILLDDTGFGASSAFGGLVETPTMDYLADNGLRFNNFHTAAISAATRAGLLTGRNHHTNHIGRFNNDQFGAPGYDTYLPMENGTIAEVLRENGYATFCIGKYNLTPVEDGTQAGPFNRWPTGRGFDHYYGYHPVSGADDQWHTLMYRETSREPADPEGRPAIIRMTDAAINFIADQKSAAPDQPFFLYYAPGTAHQPYQASKEWIEKYRGRFDAGWSEYAKETLRRQLEMGVVPEGTELPIANQDFIEWDSIPSDERRLYARQMEAFAGFLSEADHEMGRLIDFIRRIGQLDNTLIIIAMGDNGAAGTGGRVGSKGISKKAEAAFIAHELEILDKYGEEGTHPFYCNGWGIACNTPFRYYKRWADYEGGTHDGLIVFYPSGIKEKGGIRTQYTHVTDIFPTTVELTKSIVPDQINGYPQTPVQGTSFAYAITARDNHVEDRKTLQYYEMHGSYALYKDGWKVAFPNSDINVYRAGINPDMGVHLYNMKEDFNESEDLAEKYPEKVQELLAEFEKEAVKNQIYPLKDEFYADPDYPNRLRSHYDVYTGARSWGEYPFFDGTRAFPYTLSVYIDEAREKANGILVSQHVFALYVLDGTLIYATPEGDRIVASRKLPSGSSVVKVQAVHKGKRTKVNLFIDDEPVGEGELSAQVKIHGNKYAIEVGRQWGLAVNKDYTAPFPFTGKIFKASLDVDLSASPGKKAAALPEKDIIVHTPENYLSSIQRGKWKLLYRMREKALELYDVSKDPSLQKNQVGDHPVIANYLAARLGQALTDGNAVMPTLPETGKPAPMPNTRYLTCEKEWAPYYADFESEKNCVVDELVPQKVPIEGAAQGFAVHGKYGVLVRDGGQCNIFNLEKPAFVSSFMLEGNKSHCNNACFGPDYPSNRAKFPYFYVSECRDERSCYVYELTEKGSKLVQRIFFDDSTCERAIDWAVDPDNRMIYAYEGNGPGRERTLRKFRLPKVSEGAEVHLTQKDCLGKTEDIHGIYIGQGSVVRDGKIYLTQGGPKRDMDLHVFDPDGKRLQVLNLRFIGLEPEGLDIQDGWIYVAFNAPKNPRGAAIWRIKIK